MWYYNGAHNKAAITEFSKMQHQAALWITGTFKTSPTGGVGVIAGLLPVHQLLKRLSDRAKACIETLAPDHPLC